jgi:hypothetical protein
VTRRSRTGDDGQITLLTIGFVGIVAVLLAVVINASGAFLERQRLNGLADGAAVAAADALDLATFYADGTLVADAGAARDRAVQHVASSPDVRVVDVRLDGDVVTVRLERTVALPLALPGMPSVTTVVSEASGRLRGS